MRSKRLIRTCAGILSAMMIFESAAVGNISVNVYADEIEVSSQEQEIGVEEVLDDTETSVNEEALYSLPIEKCVVSFDSNGGSIANDTARLLESRYEADVAPGAKTVREIVAADVDFEKNYNGKTLEEVFVPVKVGYVFDGWKNADGSAFNFDAAASGNDIAYAAWVAKKNMTVAISVVGNPDEVHDFDKIKIETAEPAADIYYTVGGALATANDTIYNGAIAIRDLFGGEIGVDTTLKISAIAVKDGVENAVASETIEVKADWGDITDADKAGRFANNALNVPSGLWVSGASKEVYFTGQLIKFEDLEVYCGKKLLKLDKDYTVSYKNNFNAYELSEGMTGFAAAKAPAVVITGKGNYSGVCNEYFVIKKVSVTDVDWDEVAFLKTGKALKGIPDGMYEGIVLRNGVDFKVEYKDTSKDAYIETGDYEITVNGFGNFCGTTTVTERITTKSVNGINVLGSFDLELDPEYTEGDEEYWVHKTDFIIRKNDETLEKGVDYDLVYPKKAPGVGMTSFTVVGKGDYSGKYIVYYYIIDPEGGASKYSINMADCVYKDFRTSYVYDTKPCDQSGYVKVFTPGGTQLSYDNGDYIIEVKDGVNGVDNVNVGKVTLVFIGNKAPYYGRKELTFNITPRDIKNTYIPEDRSNLATLDEDGIAKLNPLIRYREDGDLVEGRDYTLTFYNNTKTFSADALSNPAIKNTDKPYVVIKGIGNYTGSVEKRFAIDGDNYNAVRINAADKVYTATANNYKPVISITNVSGKVLIPDKDYDSKLKYHYVDETLLDNGIVRKAGEEVADGDMVPVDTVLMVTVTPKGDYRSLDDEEKEKTKSAIFRIVGNDIAAADVKIPTQFYTGKEIILSGNQIVVTYGTRVLSEYDYEVVGYENNINVGTAKVTIKGINDFGGKKTVTFAIATEAMGKVISYNPNGTTGAMKDQVVTTYGTVAKPERMIKNAYKRANYTFAGWNTKADGTGIDIVDNSTLSSLDAILKNGDVLVLYAQWNPVVYSIDYHLNGAEIDFASAAHSYTADTDTFVVEVPDISTWPKGYMFGGWYKEDTYKTKVVKIDKGSAGNLNLYAKWVPYTYSVSFFANLPSGSTPTQMADEVISYGEEKALSANKFAMKGWAFVGWSTHEEDEEPEFLNGQVVTNKDFGLKPVNNIDVNIKLYAIWRQTFTVTFDSDGGNDIESQVYSLGQTLKFATPVRDGYVFGGWYTDKTYKTKISSITNKMASHYNLVAKWTPNAYTIVFNKNGGKDITGKTANQAMTVDVKKALNANGYARKGYEFAGWTTTPVVDYENVEYVNQEEVENLSLIKGAKVVLYAQWRPVKYTINYHLNKGTYAAGYESPVVEYSYGEYVELPKVERDGFVFSGWYTDLSYKSKLNVIKTTQAGDLELYAKWVSDKNNYPGRKYDITLAEDQPEFDWNGADIPDYYEYGDTFAFPDGATAPLREGYVFAGWFTNPACTARIKGITAKTYDDITLYAKWNPMAYSINYMVNAPEIVDPKTVKGKNTTQKNYKYGVATALRKNAFSIKGYTFDGWSTTPDGGVEFADQEAIKGIKNGSEWEYGDVTLYAQWTRIDYSIIYNNMNGITNYNPLTYDVDHEIILLEPQSIGKTFLGWYSDSACKKKVTKINKGTIGTVTLYAKWSKNVYNIYYNKNDGGDPNTKIKAGLVGYVTTYDKKSNTNYRLSDAERRGYEFKGWSTVSTGKNPMFYLNTAPGNDLTLYATWSIIKYKVTFHNYDNKNGKLELPYSISSKDQKLYENHIYGYKFLGWFDKKDFDPETDTPKDKILADEIGDMELYGGYEPIKYSVQYSINGAPDTTVKPDGKAGILGVDKFKLPAALNWSGHQFKGWRVRGGTGKLLAAGADVTAVDLQIDFDGEITIEAVWDVTLIKDKLTYLQNYNSTYKHGKVWNNNTKYYWNAANMNCAGCAAFAAMISDEIYGKSARVEKYTRASQIKVGDIVRINKDTHSVVIIDETSDGYILAEGNYNNSVNWGRYISKAAMASAFNYGYARK